VWRADFLTDVRSRLTAEVGICLPVLRKVPTGNFAVTRMLMPIIDALAQALHRSSTSGEAGSLRGGKPAVLLRRLGVRNASLTWWLYRQVLLHNDEFVGVRFRRWKVVPRTSLGYRHGYRRGRRGAAGVVTIGLGKLFADLVAFLDREILKAQKKPTRVWVKHWIRLKDGPKSGNAALKGEIRRLCSARRE
jgi:hypothetical protein